MVNNLGVQTPWDSFSLFVSYVEPEPNTGCWLWSGGCFKGGYGMFHIGSKSQNTYRTIRAHRFSYEYFIGPIPQGMKVLHKCDVRSCVNWEHFFLGTVQDNCDDMALKGRGTKSKKDIPFGVRIKRNGKCISQIRSKGKLLYLGTFDTPEKASEKALEKKLELTNLDKVFL